MVSSIVCTFSAEICVTFSDESRVLRYFVNEDSAKSFCLYDSVDHVAQQIACNFNLAKDCYRGSQHQFNDRRGELRRQVKGFGDFAYNYETQDWHLGDDHFPCFVRPYGEVTIRLAIGATCIKTERN